jgi:hypothetical protein
MRKVALAAAGIILLAGCGSGSDGVHGTLTDTLITSRDGCGPGNGTLQVALTDASGKVLARDSATFTWQQGACVVPFTFTSVPQLAGYGIRVMGLGAGTVYLTPQQAGQNVHLRLGPGFTVTGG